MWDYDEDNFANDENAANNVSRDDVSGYNDVVCANQ